MRSPTILSISALALSALLSAGTALAADVTHGKQAQGPNAVEQGPVGAKERIPQIANQRPSVQEMQTRVLGARRHWTTADWDRYATSTRGK